MTAMRKAPCLLFLTVLVAGQAAHANKDHKTWKNYGGGPDSSHFVDLRQIDKSNVNQLEVAWTYPTGDNRTYIFDPIVVDNVMYVLARNSSLVALTQRPVKRYGSTRTSPDWPRAASRMGE